LNAVVWILLIGLAVAIWWGFASPMPPMPPDVDPKDDEPPSNSDNWWV